MQIIHVCAELGLRVVAPFRLVHVISKFIPFTINYCKFPGKRTYMYHTLWWKLTLPMSVDKINQYCTYCFREAQPRRSPRSPPPVVSDDVAMITGERGLDKRTIASLMVIKHLGSNRRREK